MRAHPAGPRHADVLLPANTAGAQPSTPDRLNELPPEIWPHNATRGTDGVVRLAGIDVRDLAERYGTPLFVVDEADFRARCHEFATAFGDAAQVHYASKAFLSVQIARWVAEEGLGLDVCSAGELAIALRAGFPVERITLHGNNKSVAELTESVRAGVGVIVLDSFYEIARLDAITRELNVSQAVLIRATVGVEAHTHEFIATAHEDQKFGFSIASGDAAEAARRVLKCDGLRLVGLHSHIGSQIYDPDGFEIAAHRVIGLLTALRNEHGQSVVDSIGTVAASATPTRPTTTRRRWPRWPRSCWRSWPARRTRPACRGRR
jgi:diaminopimelate decarboxylase